jgi:hypothetical protein
MDYTIIQGIMNWFGKIKVYHKYRYDTYDEALKVFNEIKHNQASYDLKHKECLVTMVTNGTQVLEYLKSYRTR